MKCHLEQDMPQTNPPPPHPHSPVSLSPSPCSLSAESRTPPSERMLELVLYPAVVINHLPKKGFCITNVPFKPRKTNKKEKKSKQLNVVCRAFVPIGACLCLESSSDRWRIVASTRPNSCVLHPKHKRCRLWSG